MFKHLFKGVLAGLAIKLLDEYRCMSLHLLKIEAAKCYLQGVAMARRAAIGLIQMWLFTVLIGLGLLLLHAGLFVLLPWSVEVKAILGMCLGAIYVVIGGWALRAAMDEKLWLRQSGATEMLEDALRKRGAPGEKYPQR